MNGPTNINLPDAVSTDSTHKVDMEKTNQVGQGICGLLNGAKLTPNEAFLALMAVVGSVAEAASSSVVDQLDMRQRFCHGVMEIGVHQLRVALTPEAAPSTTTPQ